MGSDCKRAVVGRIRWRRPGVDPDPTPLGLRVEARILRQADDWPFPKSYGHLHAIDVSKVGRDCDGGGSGH